MHLTTTTAIILAAIIPIAASATASLIAYRARKTQETARANSDALRPYREAYEGATAINKQLNEGLRSEIDRLRKRLAEVERQATDLERQLVEHQATIEQLTLVLRQHNIQLP